MRVILVLFFIIINASQYQCAITINLENDAVDYEKGFLNTGELLKKYEYNYEQHFAKTPDGYILGLHRIRERKGMPKIPKNAPTILMFPRLCVSDKSFLLGGPGKSIALGLADKGFDVWMGNYRGTRNSQNHTTLSIKNMTFWDYDMYEHSMIDIPTSIDYVLDYVKKPSLHYFGLAFGGMGINNLLFLKPEYNKKVKAIYYTATAFNMKNTKVGPIKAIAQKLKFFEILAPELDIPLLFYSKALTQKFYKLLNFPLVGKLVPLIIQMLVGPFTASYDMTQFPVHIGETFNGFPASYLLQLIQFSHYTTFRMYDYGVKNNLEKYGKIDPPIIKPETILPPKVIFYGTHDIFVTPDDVLEMAKAMVNVKKIIPLQGFNHLMFENSGNIYHEIVIPLTESIRSLD